MPTSSEKLTKPGSPTAGPTLPLRLSWRRQWRPHQVPTLLHKLRQSGAVAEVEATEEDEVAAEIVAEEADTSSPEPNSRRTNLGTKIIINLLQTRIPIIQNLTRRVRGPLQTFQTTRAPATGRRAGRRPTAPTPSSAAGCTSLHPDKIEPEK